MEIRNPPGGNQDTEQGDNAEQRTPRAGGSDAKIFSVGASRGSPKGEMRQKRHDPDEGSAEESYADHEEERVLYDATEEADSQLPFYWSLALQQSFREELEK